MQKYWSPGYGGGQGSELVLLPWSPPASVQAIASKLQKMKEGIEDEVLLTVEDVV